MNGYAGRCKRKQVAAAATVAAGPLGNAWEASPGNPYENNWG